MDKNNRLRVPCYSYTRFHWFEGNGVGDASDLGIPAGAEPGDRVWADACDVGFTVQGEREDKLFIFDRQTCPGVVCWVFASEDGKHRITIVND
jgi:hypothetical protein